MGPGDLSRTLAALPQRSDPRLIVGYETFDDAGVFLLSDDLALVQTVDFFAPVVDDPFTFGQIAAANALSDVYAMGAEPLTALAMLAFPAASLPLEVAGEILRGGEEKVRESGALIVGGHSIIDEEVKYGLAVTGRADPRRLLTNASARAGDAVVLTKPLGSGMITTALKRGKASPELAAQMLEAMATLNAAASRAALAAGAVCATDVTGFGLLGHASHIARASGVTLAFDLAAIPEFPGVRDAWQSGASTGGAERNLSYLEPMVEWGAADAFQRALLVDPQTSGGLLVTLPHAGAAKLVAGVPGAVVVGEVLPAGSTKLVLR